MTQITGTNSSGYVIPAGVTDAGELKVSLASGSNMAVASNGVVLPLNNLPKSYGYTSGLLTTITVPYLEETYTQTFTYTAGNLTGESEWVLND